MSANGITVLAFDRRGSGRSGGASGDCPSEQHFLADLDAAYSRLKAHGSPAVPIYAHANCFGARVALPYIQLHPKAFRGLILTSPSTDMAQRADYSPLFGIFCILNPFVRPGHYFATPLKDEYFITQPAQELLWVKDDRKSLSLRRVTKRFLLGARALTKKMYQAVPATDLPLLLIDADQDQIVEKDKIEERFCRDWKGHLKKVPLSSEHLMERGPNQALYRKTMLQWLESGKSR